MLSFVQELVNLLPEYDVACEHEHSNCVLVAHKKVNVAKIDLTTITILICEEYMFVCFILVLYEW